MSHKLPPAAHVMAWLCWAVLCFGVGACGLQIGSRDRAAAEVENRASVRIGRTTHIENASGTVKVSTADWKSLAAVFIGGLVLPSPVQAWLKRRRRGRQSHTSLKGTCHENRALP